MAGSQFLTPKSVTPSKARKRFTLEQANKSLPLVKRIVADVVATHEKAVKLQVVVEAGGKDQQASQKDLDRAMDRLHDLVNELADIGCELKDYQMGLIDFIGRHQGHDVYLCWKLGEEQIGYWHEMQAGFAGRKPVNLLQETE